MCTPGSTLRGRIVHPGVHPRGEDCAHASVPTKGGLCTPGSTHRGRTVHTRVHPQGGLCTPGDKQTCTYTGAGAPPGTDLVQALGCAQTGAPAGARRYPHAGVMAHGCAAPTACAHAGSHPPGGTPHRRAPAPSRPRGPQPGTQAAPTGSAGTPFSHPVWPVWRCGPPPTPRQPSGCFAPVRVGDPQNTIHPSLFEGPRRGERRGVRRRYAAGGTSACGETEAGSRAGCARGADGNWELRPTLPADPSVPRHPQPPTLLLPPPQLPSRLQLQPPLGQAVHLGGGGRLPRDGGGG